MKIINRLILGLAVFAGITTSCKEDDDLTVPGGLSLEVEEITVGPEQSFKEVLVKAGVDWQASSSTRGYLYRQPMVQVAQLVY